MSFFAELERRNVVRVGTAYLVLSWLLLQVGDILFEALRIENGQTVLLAVLALGFLPVLVFAWAYELTPEGLKRDADVPAEASIARHTASRLNIAIVVMLVLAVGSFALGRMTAPSGAPEAGREAAANQSEPATEPRKAPPAAIDAPSIAVLPFADLSPDGDQAHFSDGIAEEILNVLARVDGLRVASRTSAFKFRGETGLSIPEIAAELGVGYVLEGSVRTAGDTIRVTAQLIDGRSDEHLWSQTFDRTLSVENIFAIQDSIARRIVGQLGGRMGLGQANTIRFAAAADTANLRAYALYLEARELFLDRNQANILEIIRKYEEATRLDPDFARAWEGLAAAYNVAPSWIRPDLNTGEIDYLALAVEAAERALALEPELALSLAVVATNATVDGRPDYLAAIDGMTRAIERDPAEATLWNWRGQYFVDLGYFDEAERDLQRCLELDPENDVALQWLMRVAIYRGDIDAAWELAERMSAYNGAPRVLLGIALASHGREALARDVLAALVPPEVDFRPVDWMLPALAGDVDYDAHFQGLVQEARKHFGIDLRQDSSADLLYLFKRYDQIGESPPGSGENVWWYPGHEDWPNSAHWRRVIAEMGIERYWSERGLPPQCRLDEESGYRCRVATGA